MTTSMASVHTFKGARDYVKPGSTTRMDGGQGRVERRGAFSDFRRVVRNLWNIRGFVVVHEGLRPATRKGVLNCNGKLQIH
jgi:hypothetical protein